MIGPHFAIGSSMNSNVLQKFCNAYTESINKLQFESLITSV